MTAGDVSDASRTLRITVDGGPSFEMAAGEDSLLRGALRAGIGLPHECSVGGCGACRFELLAGAMETLWAEAPGLSARDRQRGKRLACQSHPLADCTVRVRCDEAYRPVEPPRRYRARLVNRQVLTGDMTRFTFVLFDGGPDAFRPGQYALVYLPGVDGARAYSMSNVPNDLGLWEFIVRRVPQGRGSQTLFDQVHEGCELDIDGPYGHAHWRSTSRPVVCVAGGSGLGPMLSVVHGALQDPATPRVRLFIGLRTVTDLGALQVLQALKDQRLDVTTVLSEFGSATAGAPAWNGATGFVHRAVEAALGDAAADHEFYFAGPPKMIEALQELLMLKQRVPYGQIHFDRFV